MQNPRFDPSFPPGVTPGLEGAPRSRSHENRTKSVIAAPKAEDKPGEEGSVSKA